MNIKLNESKTLEFNVDTRGCKEEDLKGFLRFVFEDVEYGFPAIFESGTIKVKLPAFQTLLSNRLTESISNHKEVTVNARLDIVANNEAFVTPWSNEIDIEVPVDIQVKEEKKSVLTEKKVNVKDPELFEAFDDAVKTSKIKDMLEKDIKPEVKVEEPTDPTDEMCGADHKKKKKKKVEEEPDPIPVKSKFAKSLAEIYVKEK